MKLEKNLRRLISASCLSLLFTWQAFAAEPLQQPTSLEPLAEQSTRVTAEQDASVTPAGCCDTCCGGNNGCCGGGSCCCDAVCCPKRVTEEVKKHYWEVKSEMVCIPGFRFECNWRKGCCKKSGCDCGDTCCNDTCCCGKNCEKCPCYDPGTPTCGRVRCINVLEKHDYTCDKCGYEWEVKCIRSGRGGCCGKGGCCCPSCGSASVSTDAEDVQLTSATEMTEEEKAAKPSIASRFMGWLK